MFHSVTPVRRKRDRRVVVPENTSLEKAEPTGALAIYQWSRDQIDLIKRTVAKGTSDDELALFLHVCRRTGLDPLARQIYAIMRRQKEGGNWVEKMVIQTGIDGLRLQAERTGKFKGFGPTEWCGKDGAWRDVWLDDAVPPSAARVAVLRQDEGALEPVRIEGLALYREYVQTFDGKPMARWAAAPAHMLSKCAEALALRRAFPAELAGLFAAEEMAQAANDPEAKKVAQPTRKSEKIGKAAKLETIGCPDVSPWIGDIDDVLVVGPPDSMLKAWRLNADQGRLAFFTDQEDIKDRAASAMSNAQPVRIEWKRTAKGNAEIETLVIIMEA